MSRGRTNALIKPRVLWLNGSCRLCTPGLHRVPEPTYRDSPRLWASSREVINGDIPLTRVTHQPTRTLSVYQCAPWSAGSSALTCPNDLDHLMLAWVTTEPQRRIAARDNDRIRKSEGSMSKLPSGQGRCASNTPSHAISRKETDVVLNDLSKQPGQLYGSISGLCPYTICSGMYIKQLLS
jgi:hypothetical protein